MLVTISAFARLFALYHSLMSIFTLSPKPNLHISAKKCFVLNPVRLQIVHTSYLTWYNEKSYGQWLLRVRARVMQLARHKSQGACYSIHYFFLRLDGLYQSSPHHHVELLASKSRSQENSI